QYRDLTRGSKYEQQFNTQGRPEVGLEPGAREGGQEPAPIPAPQPQGPEEVPQAARQTAQGTPEGEGRVTGIKNVVTEAERAERGLTPIETEARKSLGASLDEGKAILDQHTDFRQQVRDWGAKPRALSDAEEGALLTDRMQLHNQSEDLLRRAKAAMDAK